MGSIGVPFGTGGGGGGGLSLLPPVTTTTGTYADITNIPNDAVFVAIGILGLRHNSSGNERYQLTLGTTTFTNAGSNNNPQISGDLASSASLNKLIILRKVSKTANRWRIWSDDGGGVTLNQDATLNGPLGQIRVGLHSVSGTERFNGGEIAVQYSSLRGSVGGSDTGDVPEGSNLYWTDTRFNTAFGNRTTDNLNEGTTNLYHTDARVDERIGAATLSSLSDVEGTATDDQLLAYDASDSKWKPKTVTVGTGTGTGISTISAADDTAISSPAAKNLLLYNTSSSDWENEPITDVVGISNTNMNVTLGTALDGGALSITANVGTRKLGLSTITAGGATAGHVLKVGSDGNSITTGSVTGGSGGGISNISEADDTDLSSIADYNLMVYDDSTDDWVNGFLEEDSISAGAITPRKAAGLTSATSGVVTVSGSTSFGTTSLPQKASAQTVAEGTDDSDFVTSLQLRNQQNSVNKGKEWSGFTYVSSSPSTGQFTVTRTNATGWEFTFATTAARAAEMDSILGRNSNFFIRVNASNDIVGKVDFAWRDGNNFGFRAKANATEQGDWRTGSATLWATGGLYPVLIDEGFLTGARLVEGNNVDLTTAADGRVTISATGSATGSIPYATQTQANDGNSSTTVISPETLHGVLDHTSHVASYPGFTLVSSSNDMPLGSVWINGTGTEARFRAHDVDESVSQTRQFLIDKSCIVEKDGGGRLDFDFTGAESIAVSGSNVGVVKCTITSHRSTPPSSPDLSGGALIVHVMPKQNKEVLENAPAGVIKGIALADGAVGPREAEGLFQKTVMKMRDSTQIGMVSNASTRFNESVASANPSAKRLWAIGDGTSSSAQFSKRTNMSLIPGTITHSGMRARPGGKYFVRIDGLGVIYCSNVDANTDLRHGADIGLGFRHKAIASNTWGSWQICPAQDITETIGGNSVTTFDASELWGSTGLETLQNDSASGNARAASIFREKRVARVDSGSFYGDVSPPFWVEFGIGEGEAFPLVDRDYQFRFIFSPAEVGGTTRINRIYSYTEILVADKIE